MTPEELQKRIQDVKSAKDNCYVQLEKASDLKDDILSVLTEDERLTLDWLLRIIKRTITAVDAIENISDSY
jgi:hypothetical protein